MNSSTEKAIIEAIKQQDILQLQYTNSEGEAHTFSFEPYVYGRDLHRELVLWGVISPQNMPYKLLAERISIAEEPLAKFMVEEQFKKQQPVDITPIAQVHYAPVEPWK